MSSSIQDVEFAKIPYSMASEQLHLVGPFDFPQWAPARGPFSVEGFSLCRRPVCKTWFDAQDSCSIHLECIKLFMRHYPAKGALRRLWTTASWRSPWAKNPPIPWLFATPSFRLRDVTGRIGEAFGLKGLDAIPSELLVKFRLLSPDTLLWRYLASIELADSLTDSEPHELEELPLSCLLSWKRGEGVVKDGSKDLEPVIRIRIDDVGISSIERLSEPPTFGRKGKENVACVLFQNEEQYENIFAQLKIRTKLRGDIILGPCLEEPERLDLEDTVLSEGTGMVLICVDSGGSESLKAIYAHSRGPFLERGNIPAKKMGDGVTSGGDNGVMIEHKYGEGVTPFRVSQPRENPFMSVYMTAPYFIDERLFEPVYFSSVFADGIVTVEVFNKPTDKGPRFQGAIFYFSDGTAQAVGQCRVGIDSCEVFHDPMWIQCEQTAKLEGSGDDDDDGYSDFSPVHPRLVRLHFSSQTDMDDVITTGWTETHYLHSAELHFWFTASEVMLTVNAFPLQGRKSYFDVDGSSDGSHDDDDDDDDGESEDDQYYDVDEDDESEDDQYYDDSDDEMEVGGGFYWGAEFE
ncbi:hypothetical protein DL767_003765 [Monosporascus sp. MG133]|nr:hypothetical protein DL767_003765 [Monosporascus sp. MG133]